MTGAALAFDHLRRTEFARLDAAGIAYLDYGGAALYGEAQVRDHALVLSREIYGNPHSAHASSRASTTALDAARRAVLDFFDAGDAYEVIFTANASAAIKLAAEAVPFAADTPLVLSADNHNSVNGVREYARRAGAPIVYLPLRDDLRLHHPEARLAEAGGGGLFAFPAQSNFSGAHHPLSLVRHAQDLGYLVLLDAAAYVPSHPLSLRACPADFVAISFYKMFGYPTGVGALIARRDALARLTRPWFAGGTVEYVSVRLDRHRLRAGHEGFEDGTPDFLGIPALHAGFELLGRIGMDALSCHVRALTGELLRQLSALRYHDGAPAVRVYGPGDDSNRGGTVAFNLLSADGSVVPYQEVEARAGAARVHVRGGCFCNPGAAEAAFERDAPQMAAAGAGALRASIGLATVRDDIHRLVAVLSSALAARDQDPPSLSDTFELPPL